MKMQHKFSFGLPEIFAIFGSYSLVNMDIIPASVLLGLSVFGIFFRFSLDHQLRKDREKLINNTTSELKETFVSNKLVSALFDGNTH
jgi:hypothetical protein